MTTQTIEKSNPFAAYPLFLTAKDIADALQVCLTSAHEMMNTNGFPLIRAGRTGKSKRVQRDEFFKWLLSHEKGV